MIKMYVSNIGYVSFFALKAEQTDVRLFDSDSGFPPSSNGPHTHNSGTLDWDPPCVTLMPDKGPSLNAIAARPKKEGILTYLGTVHVPHLGRVPT